MLGWAWHCVVLRVVAWYCVALRGIAWRCVLLRGVAWHRVALCACDGLTVFNLMLPTTCRGRNWADYAGSGSPRPLIEPSLVGGPGGRPSSPGRAGCSGQPTHRCRCAPICVVGRWDTDGCASDGVAARPSLVDHRTALLPPLAFCTFSIVDAMWQSRKDCSQQQPTSGKRPVFAHSAVIAFAM